MKPVSTFKSGSFLLILSMFLIAATVSAQDSKDASNYHPFLSDKIYMNLGVFNARNTATVGVGIGGVVSEEFDTSKDANGWIIVDMKKDWKKVFPKK